MVMKMMTSPQHPWMTWYGLRNLYQTEICAFISLTKSETSYLSQIPTAPQKPMYESIIQEMAMDSIISDMPNLINVPKEVFFLDFLYPPWM